MLGWLRSIARIPRAFLDLQIDVTTIRSVVLGIPTAHTRIERLIMTTASDLVARLDAATNEIAADLRAARDAATAAVADKDQAVRDAVAAALAELEGPIARVEALGADEADPVPAAGEPGGEPVADSAETPQS